MRRIKDNIRKSIIDDYLNGIPNIEIAKKYSIGTTSVSRILNDNNIKLKKNIISNNIKHNIVHDYVDGLTNIEIMDKYNISNSAIYRALKYCNMKSRSIKHIKGRICSLCECHNFLKYNQKFFCSRRCYGIWYTRNITGFNHPMYGGYSKELERIFGVNKYRKLRKEILKRDNYECQLCNSKKYLEVHHIYNRKEFPELIYDIDNMITLCVKCHHKFEGNEYIGLFEFVSQYDKFWKVNTWTEVKDTVE